MTRPGLEDGITGRRFTPARPGGGSKPLARHADENYAALAPITLRDTELSFSRLVDRTSPSSTAELRSETTPSSPFSRSSRYHRGTTGATSDQAGGEEAALYAANDLGLVPVTSCSPRIHARGTSGTTRGRIDAREETPAPRGIGPSPVIVVCTRCREPIRRNETLRISFCPVHGLSQPFTFISLAQRWLTEA